jgi:hypothetical protein
MTQQELNAAVAAAVEADLDLLTPFHNLGYSCVLHTPDEIGDADIDTLEDIMIERGSCYLEGGTVP